MFAKGLRLTKFEEEEGRAGGIGRSKLSWRPFLDPTSAQNLSPSSPPGNVLLASIIRCSESALAIVQSADGDQAKYSLASPLIMSRCPLSNFSPISDRSQLVSVLHSPTEREHGFVKIACSASRERSQ